MRPPAPVTAAEHGVWAEPFHATLVGHETVVVDEALAMAKVVLPLLARCVASPAKLALAVAVPAEVLLEYETVKDWENPPEPVAVAVQGVCAEPVYVTDVGHDTVVVVAVFDGFTVTTKVAGARSKVPPLLLDVRVREMVEVPAVSGVTVMVRVAPQLSKVTLDGLTVATEALEELTAVVSVVDPVRLQPLLPSLFVGSTASTVEPLDPPAVSVMLSAAASMVPSRLL